MPEMPSIREFQIVRCPIHGSFHFGPKTDLTPGLPDEISN